jgi:hypothetical protein
MSRATLREVIARKEAGLAGPEFEALVKSLKLPKLESSMDQRAAMLREELLDADFELFFDLIEASEDVIENKKKGGELIGSLTFYATAKTLLDIFDKYR